MGSVFPVSKQAQMIPALGLGFHEEGRSLCDDALPVAGAGLVADSVTAIASSLATGVFVFETHESFGLELHAAQVGLAGVSSTSRVFREIPMGATEAGQPGQYTYRHLCDITWVASSAQAGCTDGLNPTTNKWSVPTVTSDAGLAPLGCRVMQGTTAGAAGSVVIDPLGAGRVIVITKKGTADYIGVWANKYTGL
jgi:hypothetical protein